MIRILWEIQARRVRGRLRQWLRLARQPKYLAGLLIGLAWMGWWLRPALTGNVRINVGPTGLLDMLHPDIMPLAHAAAGLLLAVLLTVAWAVPLGGSSLRLSEAEAHLLLPAPLARRHVIHYALLRSQPGILLGSVIMTLFLGSGPALQRLLLLPVCWLLLTLWDVHMKARSLWWGRIRELPGAVARRRVLFLAGVLLAFWIPVMVGLLRFVRESGWPGTMPADLDDLVPHLLAAWIRAGAAGPGDELLAGLGRVVSPLFADGLATRALAMVFPALLLAVHHEWAVRFRTRFEEEAVAREREQSARRSPFRALSDMSARRRRQAPFRLDNDGTPAVAVLWKNAMQSGRMPLTQVGAGILGLMVLVILLPLPFGQTIPYVLVTGLGLILVPILSMFSVFQLRHDFRTDLLNLEVVRTWPLDPAALALAEIAGPILTAGVRLTFALALVVAGDLGLRLAGGPGNHRGLGFFPPEWSAALGVPDVLLVTLLAATAGPILLALCAVATGVLNVAALIFPSWIQLGSTRRGGAAHLGQGLLTFWAVFFCLAVAAVPATLLVGTVLGLHWFLDAGLNGWELPGLALLAAAPLLVECGGLALLCGRLWRRLDPSAEMLSGETV